MEILVTYSYSYKYVPNAQVRVNLVATPFFTLRWPTLLSLFRTKNKSSRSVISIITTGIRFWRTLQKFVIGSKHINPYYYWIPIERTSPGLLCFICSRVVASDISIAIYLFGQKNQVALSCQSLAALLGGVSELGSCPRCR